MILVIPIFLKHLFSVVMSTTTVLAHRHALIIGFSWSVMPRNGVAALGKGTTIVGARRLVAEHDRNAEPDN